MVADRRRLSVRSRVRRRALLACALLLVACDSPTVNGEAPAYDAAFLDGARRVIYHWPLGRTIAIYADATGAPAGRDLRAAIEEGAAAWAAAVYYREFDIQVVNDLAAADVTFHFELSPPPVNLDACPFALLSSAAVTGGCLDNGLTRFLAIPFTSGAPGSRVKLDVTLSTDPLKIPDAAVFRSVVAHELGHVLGIGQHSNDATDLMFAGPRAAGPSDRDARTLRWVLHQPAQLRLE
ncbi:MAG: hypothetical protein WKG32_07315 [Gemmatimonadaceae bacterium]